MASIDSAHARHAKVLLRLRKPPLRTPRKSFVPNEDSDSATESLTGSWDPSTATSNVLCAAITGSVLSGE